MTKIKRVLPSVHACMISVPPVISYSVLKNMQKFRLVASLVEEVSFNMF